MSEQVKEFDQVGFIMAFEGGELSDQEVIDGIQNMIDTGIVWQLQGFYGRTAARLIQRGLCVDTHNVLGKAPTA